MKEYPLTREEMNELASVGLLATICFALSTGLFGFAIDVTKDIAFAPEIPEKVLVFWDTLKTGAFILSILLFLAGLAFLWRGRSRLNSIVRDTEHGE